MIKCNVTNVAITLTETETLTAGRVGLECQFSFSSEWDGLAITAYFLGSTTKAVVVNGDTVTVPAESMAEPGYKLYVGVVGKNAQGNIVIPTLWASAGKIKRSPGEEEEATPSPDVVAQIQLMAMEALEKATYAKGVIDDNLEAITEAGETQTEAVNTEGSTQVLAIQTESTTQQAAIAAAAAAARESIPEDYTALTEEVNDVKSAITQSLQIDSGVQTQIEEGKFINATNNAITSASGFSMTNPIPVKKGQKATLSAVGYSTTTGMIATCDEENTTRTVVVASNGGGVQNYVYDVLEDGYIVCSFWGTNFKLTLTCDYYQLFDDVALLDPIHAGSENVPVSVLSTGFINASNSQYSASNNFNVSNSVKLYKGQKVSLQASGYSTAVGMINLYDPNSNTYQTVVASVDGAYRTYEYTATKDCFVRFSYSKSSTPVATIVTTSSELVRIAAIESEIDDLKDTETYAVRYPQIFSNVICIGDSLTYGHDGQTRLETNYPYYFAKLADVTVSNQGLTGRSAKEWWDELGSSYANFADFDCAIIYLGTNGGLTDTVATDCNASDYTQNADTNTGCYGKIIGKIKADAPNCKIFCVGGPTEYVQRTAMNNVINQIATLYGVAYLDLTNCILSDDGATTTTERRRYRPYDGIHYNRLGYFTFANMIYDYMENYLVANVDFIAT